MKTGRLGLYTVVFAAALTLAVRPAAADLSLSLTSPDDLANLTLGQTITIEAHLAGLEAGQELASLGADIPIDPAVFVAVTPPTAGPIVPDPASNFIALADPDLATGAFFLFAGPEGVTADGLLFSFTLTVAAEGAGSLLIDPDALFAEQPGGVVVPVTTGPPLAFNVPEPATLLALCVPAAALLHRRSRRAQPSRTPRH